jgi:hypothetical protein
MTIEEKTGAEPYFTPIDDQNKNVDRTCAQLCIYSGSIHPDSVTKLLGITPTRVVAVGEPGRTNSLGLSPVGKLNGWFLSSENYINSKDLRHHVDWLINQLQKSRADLLSLQGHVGVSMYVSCPFWTCSDGGSATLWPQQLLGLAQLNLEVTISFADYGHAEKG